MAFLSLVTGLLLVIYFLHYQSTDPEQPVPDKKNIERNVTELHIHWKPPIGVVEYYNVTANCSCNCKLSVRHVPKDTAAYVSNLTAGSHCYITITSVSGGRYSQPLIYPDIETVEKGKS